MARKHGGMLEWKKMCGYEIWRRLKVAVLSSVGSHILYRCIKIKDFKATFDQILKFV